jgi:hypothetical protein
MSTTRAPSRIVSFAQRLTRALEGHGGCLPLG